MTIRSAAAKSEYFINLHKVIFDLKVKDVLIRNPNIIVRAAAKRTDHILERFVDTRIRARTRLLNITVIVPVIKYFPKVCLWL